MKDIQQSFQLKETVSLCNSGITDQQFEIICEKYTGKVRKLDLQRNFLTAAGIVFMKDPKWANLRELHLWKNTIGDSGCKFLSQVAIPHLNWLNLINNLICSTGASHITKGRWPRLQQLFLTQNRVGLGGISGLSRADFNELCKLEIDYNLLTDSEGVYLLMFERQYLVGISLSGNRIGWLSKLKLEKLLNQKFKDPLLKI